MTRLSSKNQRYVSYLTSFEPLLCHPLLFGAVPVPLVTAMTRMSSLAIEIEIAFFPVSDSLWAVTHDIRCHRPTPTCHIEHWRACCYRSTESFDYFCLCFDILSTESQSKTGTQTLFSVTAVSQRPGENPDLS